MTPDQDAALAAYFTEWADILADPDYQLAISYTDTGPTLDLHHDGRGGRVYDIRWLIEPPPGTNTKGHR